MNMINIGGVQGLSITQQTLDMMKASLAGGTQLDGNPAVMQKGISVSTGLVEYDLAAPAKNLYPTITPLRNSIPRFKRMNPGDAAHWKQVSATIGSGWDSMGWVPEGQRAGTMSYVTANLAASYVTIGEEDFLTFEAESAAEGFEDINSTLTFRLLQKMMRKEENGILGGNGSLALGTPYTPTATAGAPPTGVTATLPAATYSVIVVALTYEGFKNSKGLLGVPISKVITGADGKQFTLYGGSSNKSGNVTQAVTLGQSLYVKTLPLQGAAAYAWFVGPAGSETWQAMTTTASAIFSYPLLVNTQPASTITGDSSRNPGLAFDGLLTCALNPNAPFFQGTTPTAGQAYIDYLPNGNGGLTASGRGSCVEIDDMLQIQWNNFNIGPTMFLVNAQEQKNLTTACLTNATGPLLRYDVPTTPGQAYGIVAGGVIDYYYNPYSVDGGYKVPVKLHPDVPPGMILSWCENLPPWYQSNEVPAVAQMLLRRDYYRVDWPLRTRQREYGVYAEEVLAVYATFAMGVIANIENGVNA
jgi:hypothetical protein